MPKRRSIRDQPTSILRQSLTQKNTRSMAPPLQNDSIPCTKASMTIIGLLQHRADERAPTLNEGLFGLQSFRSNEDPQDQIIDVLLEGNAPDAFECFAHRMQSHEALHRVTDHFCSARLRLQDVEPLLHEPALRRMHIKKPCELHLDHVHPLIGLRPTSTIPRVVPETGKGVAIGIIDSGFDLTHPMFRDPRNRLRVQGLWDQRSQRQYSQNDLERELRAGNQPGRDDHGHGTHVASLAAGSLFKGLEGIAPHATFILVKSDFRNIETAAQWIFQTAGETPCVLNLSMGHHWGPHDGTTAQERAISQLTGPGKLIVVSAGNEREDRLHLCHTFFSDQIEFVPFTVFVQSDGTISVVLTAWHHHDDRFELELTDPSGQRYPLPPRNHPEVTWGDPVFRVMGSQKDYPFHDLVQFELTLNIGVSRVAPSLFRGWQVKIHCVDARHGRLDLWFHKRGAAQFESHHLVEEACTVSIPSTSAEVLSVASYVSKTKWRADQGPCNDYRAVIGRISSFSNHGPTRDGRNKPDLCAPGQYLTAALGSGSGLSLNRARALTASRLLTSEGTSMAAPIVSGVVALALQRRPGLTMQQLQAALPQGCHPLGTTMPSLWDPAAGYGLIDIPALMNLL